METMIQLCWNICLTQFTLLDPFTTSKSSDRYQLDLGEGVSAHSFVCGAKQKSYKFKHCIL